MKTIVKRYIAFLSKYHELHYLLIQCLIKTNTEMKYSWCQLFSVAVISCIKLYSELCEGKGL